MNRRAFIRNVCSTFALSLAGFRLDSTAHQAPPEPVAVRKTSKPMLRPLPKQVAGVRIPDSALARTAIEETYESSSVSLFNHTLRTYLFGQLMGQSMRLLVDDELLFSACVMHDLGLTERHMGPGPFQINSADAAQRLLQQHRVSKQRMEVVWDGIALHPYGEIASRKRPEVALVSSGAGTDVLGYALDQFPRKAVAEVLAAFPRLAFKAVFVKTCANIVCLYPDGASDSFMEDIGRRYVHAYHPTNICDAILTAPFNE